MKPGALYKLLLIFQGMYTMITAIWALVDIESFMKITGPKTDIWLVKTVAVLLIPIALCLVFSRFSATPSFHPVLIGLLSAVGLAVIDFIIQLMIQYGMYTGGTELYNVFLSPAG